jgi:hypothetical protein
MPDQKNKLPLPVYKYKKVTDFYGRGPYYFPCGDHANAFAG